MFKYYTCHSCGVSVKTLKGYLNIIKAYTKRGTKVPVVTMLQVSHVCVFSPQGSFIEQYDFFCI